MNSKTKRQSYSNLLIKFIQPLLTGEETEEEYLEKATIGQWAWNFAVSDKTEMIYDDYSKAIFKQITSQHPEAKLVLNKLVLRKQNNFAQHDQYIAEVSLRRKNKGEAILHVKSAPAFVLSK